MHIIIHFLNIPCFLWSGPIIITPMMPLMTGLPPTAATASGKISFEKKGWIKKDNVIEIALNMPK